MEPDLMTGGDANDARRLRNCRRIVVKIGSALLVDNQTGALHLDWLNALAADLKQLAGSGADLLVVSSGAIALGRRRLKFPSGDLKLEEAQAAAAVGQIELAKAWAESLQRQDMITAQILLTLGDTEQRRRYLNARATLSTLLKIGAVPVINENDTVATSEIRYGDNDRLAARVAAMIGADCLVLLSDVDGLYSAPPADNPDARFIDHVANIDSRIEAMAGAAGSNLSRGGMKTKIEAGKIALAAGAAMVIASGHENNPLKAVDQGGRATWFAPQSTPATARKAWIAGHLEPRGAVHIDAGAVNALHSGKSLLPAGISTVTGDFSRGDAIVIMDHDGLEIGRGLSAYDASEAAAITGCKSSEIETILGYPGRSEMIHRDDMVLRDR
jgi:glutamate 5-kinase